MQHFKSLDGIRAVAIAMVMCFHFGYFAPGWIGVQIFFTLSGYLITGILLRNKQKSFGIFVGTFFWHRALRILPLLAFFIISVASVYAATGAPASFPSDWPWLVSFAANFARIRQNDIGPAFVHIWSLAVEQQFYLIWPLLVYLLPVLAFRRVVILVLLLAPALRFAIFYLATHFGCSTEAAGKIIYVLPFTQLDAFAAGAAIPAFSLENLQHPGRRLAMALIATGALGFAVLVAGYYGGQGAFLGSLGYAMFLIQAHGYVWGYSMLNLLSMIGIICALRHLKTLSFMESRIFAWVGRISYGMYVYHVPLLLIGEVAMAKLVPSPSPAARFGLFIIWVIVVLMVSDASFRWIESPFLAMKNRGWIANALRQAAAEN